MSRGETVSGPRTYHLTRRLFFVLDDLGREQPLLGLQDANLEIAPHSCDSTFVPAFGDRRLAGVYENVEEVGKIENRLGHGPGRVCFRRDGNDSVLCDNLDRGLDRVQGRSVAWHDERPHGLGADGNRREASGDSDSRA